MKPLIYLSSPFTIGDQLANARDHMLEMAWMIQDGHAIPLAPLAMISAQLVAPMTHAEWMEYDLALLARCDALYVFGLQADIDHSRGVQMEIDYARKRHIEILHRRIDVRDFADRRGRR